MRTSHTMKLEDQENREERLQKAIEDRAEQIKQEVPKYLWDASESMNAVPFP